MKRKMNQKIIAVALAGTLVFSQAMVASATTSDVYQTSQAQTPQPIEESSYDFSYYIINDGTGIEIAGLKNDYSGEIIIPDYIENLPVTMIGWSAFSDYSTLTKITLPSTLINIDDNAFYNCEGLESIDIPNSVKTIGSSAFSGCTNLATVTASDNIEYIEANVFNNTAWLNNYPDSIAYLNNWVVKCSRDLPENATLNIKDGIVGIAQSAFYGCKTIETITLPDSLKTIGKSAFYSCENLKNINIPTSIEEIPGYMFNYCSSLESVEIPNSIKIIGDSAFNGCENLKNITIPESVTEIGSSAFSSCEALISVKIPESVTSIGSSAFSKCLALKEINIPLNIENIELSTFSYCENLETITIPDSVVSMSRYVFKGCKNLKGIIIPDSVQSIGDYTFTGCDDLTIYAYASSNNEFIKNFASEENITYEEIEKITLDEMASIESIIINTLPNKLNYKLGTRFDTTGLTLIVNFKDGTTKNVIVGFIADVDVLNTAGTQTVTIKYASETATFEINVDDSMEFGMRLNKNYAFINGRKETTTSYNGYYTRIVIINGKALIPIRYVGETLNLNVEYDNDTNAFEVYNDEMKMIAPLNSSVMTKVVDGVETDVDAGAKSVLVKGVSYVPLRTLLSEFGLSVNWFEDGGYLVVTDYVTSNDELLELLSRVKEVLA